MRQIAIYNFNTSPGVYVIINNLIGAFKARGINIIEVDNCDNTDYIYMPYGIKAAYICSKKKRDVLVDLMVDYLSLGCKNRAFFQFCHHRIFTKNAWKEMIAFFVYKYYESVVCKNLNHHLLVSYNDIIKIKQRFPKSDYIYVPNGCSIPEAIKPKVHSSKIRLTVLSNWTTGTLADINWFIEEYFPYIKEQIPEVELNIAGKCVNSAVEKYFTNNSNVNYLGWVDSLNDLFSNTDIYVATVPKGCGVLNKVLDAFAHKTLCIGLPASFTGFYGLKNGYIECETPEDYVKAIKLTIDDPEKINRYIETAYSYINANNNWEKNYSNLVDSIIESNKKLFNS